MTSMKVSKLYTSIKSTKVSLSSTQLLADHNWNGDTNSSIMADIKTLIGESLPLVASGKVRELYEVDHDTLLFVASDRISAYDVIMKNVSEVMPVA